MRTKRIFKKCRNCNSDFSLPPCNDFRDHFCSRKCGDEWRKAKRVAREKHCEICGIVFIPRPTQIAKGHGRFCSVVCRHKGITGYKRSQEYLDKYSAIMANRLPIMRGENNPRWNGGKDATAKRRRPKNAAYLKKWRKANPAMVREQILRRRGKKIGKLPRGTVKKIFSLQRGRCAICCAKLKPDYHVDHIMPLALGGKHEPDNIQILCPTCNVKKSAKDPIKYANELGKLL